jgi:hypothetical protein
VILPIAHQGAWDEILLLLAIPILYLMGRRIADWRRQRRSSDPEP